MEGGPRTGREELLADSGEELGGGFRKLISISSVSTKSQGDTDRRWCGALRAEPHPQPASRTLPGSPA